MRRLLTLAAVLAAGPAFAEYPPGPDKDGVVRIRLEVSPAKPPVPAGRYNLYPEYRDQQPGNRVQGLLRTFSEQAGFFFNNEKAQQRDKWLRSDLAELPADVRQQAGVDRGMMYGKTTVFLGIADYAARFSRTEWNEYFDLRKDGVGLVLPEVQQMRQIAATVALRLRGEIKASEWERAVESVKTLWGIAQALEQHPTLIGNLVGAAIFQIGLNGVEEMAGQPNAPSLFWALAAVPTLPIDTRHGLGGERVFLTAQFQSVLEARRPMTAAELAPSLEAITQTARSGIEQYNPKNSLYKLVADDPAKWLAGSVADPARLAAARDRLVARGWDRKLVLSLPDAQTGLLNELYRYEDARDDLFKWYGLPHRQALTGMAASEQAMREDGRRPLLADLFLPALFKVKTAETRIVQRTALLRAVEAVRLHVGATGQLPATLADTKLPLADDPFTGKPFAYSLKDGVATLRGANASADPARFVVEYAIRVRK